MVTEAARGQAVLDLVGALCYGLLKSFEAGARGATAAPTVTLAEEQAAAAAEELERYRLLRARLDELTDDPERAMTAFRAPLDAFYEQARPDDWLEAQVFQFVGDTITTDFAELVAPRLDPDTADAVRRALTHRSAQQAFALEQIGHAVGAERVAAQERIARYAGTMVGQALNQLREALLANDALEVLFGEGGVKEMVLELLGRHRERLERLGLDTLE